MWQDTYSPENMMGWGGAWNWFMSFHGLFTVISLAIIVFVCIALYRDWRRDQLNDPGMGKTNHE